VDDRRRPTTRVAALPAGRGLPALGRFAPSWRSLLVGLALLAAGLLAYLAARDTSLFAVRTVVVRGGTPELRADVRQALRGQQGVPLLRIDENVLDRALGSVSGVRSFTFDREFPNTLEVVVRAERPVLLVRQGASSYLVSASGRVLRTVPHPRLSRLPRVWVTRDVALDVNAPAPLAVRAAAAALAALQGAPLPGGVRVVEGTVQGLTLVLSHGVQVRLGDSGDLRLKLAIARRLLVMTGLAAADSGYLDVSVPQRPVVSLNSQPGG
jgi:cell division protein FtsQ